MMRLARAALVGAAGTAVDLLVLLVLHRIGTGPAAVVGCLAGGAVNFTLQRSWVFAANGSAWKQAALYACVVVGGGALVSGVVVAAIHALGAPLVVAKLGAIGLVLLGWTYPMSARVVFAPAHPCPDR